MSIHPILSRISMFLLGWMCMLCGVSADPLLPLVYTGTNGGAWEVTANWTPNGAPTSSHAVYITNRTVHVAAEATAGRLEVVEGALIVAGATTKVLEQTPSDLVRTDPVGLTIVGDYWLAGDCSIGGVNQTCESYLTVGGDLTLSAGKALAIYAGPRTTEVFTHGGAQVTVAGTTVVNTGSWIYPDCDPYTGAPVVFDLQNLTILADAGFDASQRGWGYRNMGPDTPPTGTLFEKVNNDYYWTLAPGAGASYSVGGGYGGDSGATSATRGKTYGYQYAPFLPGSPNGIYGNNLSNSRRGGGAIRISASNMVLEGALHANSGIEAYYGSSSGGGIWVTCDQIDFGVHAKMSTVGGDNARYSSGGGGGRISVGVGLFPEAIASLYAGEEPAELRYQPLTQIFANVRGGQTKSEGFSSSGTATLVMDPNADRFLQVTGSPRQAGVPASGYGTHRYALNEAVTHTAPLYGQDPASEGEVRYSRAGYTLADPNGGVVTGTTAHVTIDMTNNFVLTWLWQNREFRYRTAAGDNGRVSIGAETNMLFEQWMAEGATTDFTVEAIPDAGYRFLCWEGDRVMGEAFSPQFTVPTRLQGRTLTARFVPLEPVLTDKVYTGANNGAWEIDENWMPSGVPSINDAVYITNKVVFVTSEAVAGDFVLSGGALIVAGKTAAVTQQEAKDAMRTEPVGFFVLENMWLAGNVSIGGEGQSCTSYLTVGGDLTLTDGKALAVYAGPRQGLYPFKNGGARVTVAGTTTVGDESWVYPDCDTFTGHPVVFDLQNLTVAAAGGFDATQRGWGYVNAGPRIPDAPDLYERSDFNYWDTTALGKGFDYNIGGGYGGKGGGYSESLRRGFAYGNEYAPLYPGSPNGMYPPTGVSSDFGPPINYRRGGGTVRIFARDVILDGMLKADAGSQSNFGGSSGGSIWLISKKPAVFGSAAGMSAQGGLCGSGYTSPGGGGRVAVAVSLDVADLEALAIGETPAALQYRALTDLTADVSGGRGKRNGTIYEYGEAGSATFVANTNAVKTLDVGGQPVQAGRPTPVYGSTSFAYGQWVTNSVSVYGMDADVDNRVRYRHQGYTVENEGGIVDSGTTNSVPVQLNEDLTLTWIWDYPEMRYDVSAGAHGTIRAGTIEGGFSEWLTPGTMSTSVEAVPDSGYEFLYWLGDVPYAMATNNPLQFATDVPRSVQALFRLSEAPTTRVWNGGAAALGAWHDAANWLPGGNIPGKADHVVINAGYCMTTNYAECGSLAINNAAILRVASWATAADRAKRTESNVQQALTNVAFHEGRLLVHGDLDMQQSAQLGLGGMSQTYAAALEVGGDMRLHDTASLAVYGGPTNQMFDFVSGTALVRVGGLLKIGTNCWVYPTSEPYTGGSPRFEAKRLSVDAGSGFDATERGFNLMKGRDPETLAPGQGNSYNYGAGYGGVGGRANTSVLLYGRTYGFANAPIYPGSCNGEYQANTFRPGGGLVRLHVTGTATLNGSLISDGSQATTYGGSSGGGIWVTAGRFECGPSAVFQARGGASNYAYSGGGGGRIALGLKLTGDDLAQLCEIGEPVSKGVEVDAEAFALLYPGVTIDVLPVKTDSREGNSAQPGTFVLLDVTSVETVILVR